MIEAKTIIPNQYWILRQHDRKIGNIEADRGGFAINVNGEKTRVDNLDALTSNIPIRFQSQISTPCHSTGKSVHGYPTSHVPHNPMFDVRYQLPLWARDPNSRSWMAAGWFKIKQHRSWKIVLCPKLIVLQRYDYRGPFCSKDEALKS